MAEEVIGRSGELLSLAAFVEAVPNTGQALVLEGEAGIGKTVLWQEGLRLADEHGFRVLRSRSSPSETQIGFATISDLFAPVVDETVPLLVALQRRALESALLLREPGRSPPDARVLGLALVSVVRSLARNGPLLVAVDDAQWVDASSAELLAFALRRLEDEPVGVLATVRGRSVQAPFELDRAFAELGGDRIRFTHPLLAPACYTAMPLHRRRRVHQRLAELDIDPEERARHLAIASPGADEEIAAALDAAARHAHGRGAAQAAAELAERAVALTPVAAVEDVGRRRIAAAELCAYAGDLTRARALLEEVVDSAAPGPLRAEGLCPLANVRRESDGNAMAGGLPSRGVAPPRG